MIRLDIILILLLMISKIFISYHIKLYNSSKLYLKKNICSSKMINNNNNDKNKAGFSDISLSNENEDDICETSDGLINWLERIDISIKKSRKIKGGNYVQIATVDENGVPNCRTVVFRGFLKYNQDKNLAIKMITDSRSEKVDQIKFSPMCEMVWWFSQSSEQYRIKGILKLISNDQSNESEEEFQIARKQMWGNLSDPAREQFYWLQPGKEYDGIPVVPNGGRDNDGKVLNPPNTFLLMLLIPTSVKYLRLKDNFAQNDKIQDNNKWISTRVNP